MDVVDEPPHAPEPVDMQRSTRDLDVTRGLLERWLTDRLPAGSDPRITSLVAPSANGMSSETLLLDVEWDEDGKRPVHELVARVAPESTAVPVFETYDLHRQFEVMREVGARTSVPVPRGLWSEPDETAIGSPFFVMERIVGEVPPDVMPYNFGESWLYHASREDQSRLQESSVAVLAELHGIEDAETVFAFLASPRAGSSLRRHVDDQKAYYEWAIKDGPRSPLIERMFAWLEDHWPADEGPTVLSWGDSRIGNMMFRDFQPVAVLDWEMAALAPPEMDVAWMIFMHRAFEDLAQGYGLGGMPHFMRRDDVLATYEHQSGYTPRDLEFFTMYAGLRWGVVMIRTQLRQIHFGQAVMPDEADDLIITRDTLERMVAGTYWDQLG